MDSSDERALAWALADSVTALLTPADRTRLYAKIGAGEQDSAISDLLAFYANTDAVLPSELAAPILAWIQGYAGSDSEPILRQAYERIAVSFANTVSSQRPEVELDRSPQRLVAKRGRHAVGIDAKGSPPYAGTRVVICGVVASVEEVVDATVEAHGAAPTTIEFAVRKAR